MTIARFTLSAVLMLAFVSRAGAEEGGAGAAVAGVRSPEAVSEAAGLVVKGQAAEKAGNNGEAWNSFSRASSLDRANPEPARGLCRLSLALHKQKQANEHCQRAGILGRTSEDLRNRVAAFLIGPALPTMADAINASFMADGAVRIGGKGPWGYLARAELAQWFGDKDALDAALADLRRVAPEHQETKQLSVSAAPSVPLWVWGGQLLVVGAVLSTVIHAANRWRRSRARTPWGGPSAPRDAGAPVAALILLLAAVAAPRLARAAGEVPPPRPVVDDANPEAAVAVAESSGNPLALSDLIQELADRGLKAVARGDHAAAARYWTAVTKAVPDRAYGWGRLCEAQQELGQLEQALVSCRTAVTHDGSMLADYKNFIGLILAKGAPLTKGERHQVDVAIAQVAKQPEAAVDVESFRCRLAAHEHDVPALRACGARLAALAPDDLRTAYAGWALALETGDRTAATAFIDRVRADGRHGRVVDAMEESTRLLAPPRPSRLRRAVRWGGLGAIAFAGALLTYWGIVGLVRALRRHRRFEAAAAPFVDARPE